jgi:hypothetical protein
MNGGKFTVQNHEDGRVPPTYCHHYFERYLRSFGADMAIEDISGDHAVCGMP